MGKLKEYQRKRDFEKTGEPAGQSQPGSQTGNRFCIQKHAARRLHYDLRLEMEGVLRSWAVPKGPSLNPDEKRLAVNTEDHPLEYLDFEGVIPKGQYGAGSMIVWDLGTFECLGAEQDPVRAWNSGTLDLLLKGQKLQGQWILVKIKDSDQDWLLIKKDDRFSDRKRNLLDEMPESVLSGLEVEELMEGAEVPRLGRYRRLLSDLQVEPSEPSLLPDPMLPTLVDEVPEGPSWTYELKYDGFRALAEKKTAEYASIRGT